MTGTQNVSYFQYVFFCFCFGQATLLSCGIPLRLTGC